ncbi:Winged helix-like DNA-binding domain superfamily [Sesbania bispinosa]|nr:Winged helix-like DNA-binding domain superfamily [Sesbania bispinosa]
MSMDLLLKPSCSGCGSTTDLYGSNCKHMTLCLTCGKTMAENKAKCFDCGATVTRLIREYNVRASSSNDKNYFIGRFVSGLPDFSKKKSAENKWSLQKDGLQSRQVTDALREKYKNKPWLLEDETGQSQYQGHLEGAQSATYYLLMMERKEFVAIPAGSCKSRQMSDMVAQYKQLTLEEAEEKMKNRKKTADGYERWMMKAANNGPAAFGERNVKFDEKESNVAGGKSRKKTGDDDEGDDWEHEEIFTDDDEAVGNDPEEREDLAPEVPAPPEIKQMDDEVGAPPVVASKQKDAPKEEPADNSPLKPTATGTARGTSSTSKSSKGKRKLNEETKASNGAPPKKVKTENEPKLSVKDENGSASKSNAPPKGTPAPSSKAGSSTTASGPVSEEEIRAVLMQKTPVTTQDLVAKFKARLRSSEDKKAFAEILKRISKIQKTANGSSYVILRDR